MMSVEERPAKFVRIRLYGGPFDGGDAAVELSRDGALRSVAVMPLPNDVAHKHALYALEMCRNIRGILVPFYCYQGRE